MSEARMERMEDMMHQLIGMVGTVISTQNVMKDDITRLNERVDRVCNQHEKSFQYLHTKVSQHDLDIYVLQQSQL